MEQMCVPANGVNPLKAHLVLCHTSFSLASSIVRAIYYDDEDVEKDTSLPGQLSVHLVEKIWILVNFIMREDSFDIRPGHFYW